MSSGSMWVLPEEMRSVGAEFGRLGGETGQAQGRLRQSWGRLDAGWQSYAKGNVEGQYRAAMDELRRMSAMLEQMGRAVHQTADRIEEADQAAVGFFGDVSVGEAGSGRPPGLTKEVAAVPVTDRISHGVCVDEACEWMMDPETGRVARNKPIPTDPVEAWRVQVLSDLLGAGSTSRQAGLYIIQNDIEIGYKEQSASAACWWPDEQALVDEHVLKWGIYLDPNYCSMEVSAGDPGYAEVLGAIAHEAKHIEQGPLLALSIEGEVEGWRTEFVVREELKRAGFGEPITDSYWEAIATLPDNPSDDDLRQAQADMMAYSPGYRAWAIPLRPDADYLPEYISTLAEHGMGEARHLYEQGVEQYMRSLEEGWERYQEGWRSVYERFLGRQGRP